MSNRQADWVAKLTRGLVGYQIGKLILGVIGRRLTGGLVGQSCQVAGLTRGLVGLRCQIGKLTRGVIGCRLTGGVIGCSLIGGVVGQRC